MDMFTSISSSTKTLPFSTHIDNNVNMEVYRDNSFSSYINGKDDNNFIHKLTESTRYLHNPNMIPGNGGHGDGEIGVFGAEKYFNGGMDDDGGSQKSTTSSNNTRKGCKKLDKVVIMEELEIKPKPWLATPSVVGSESSSINSQKPLLKIVKTTTTITNDNNNYSTENNNNNNNYNNIPERNSKSFLSNTLIGYCMCYSCKDKHAVDVKEDVGEISFSNAVTAKRPNNKKLLEEDQTPSFREKNNNNNNHFSFPTGGTTSLKVVHFQEEEVERKSLEVFGSAAVMGRLRNYKPISLEKRLAMLSWDHTNNHNHNNNNNNLGGLFYNDDEVNSDCSSDLFEIESLTKQTNPFQSPTPSCYAPSEASVEWSVVTASALDFDERRPSTTSPARVVAPPRRVNYVNNKEVVVVAPKRRSGSLLGCKSEKAVKVAEESNSTRKMTAKSNSNSNSDYSLIEQRKSQSARFEDDTKVGGFSFRSQAVPPLVPPPHRALATRSLPRPYSPRLSNITFNIQ